MSEDIHYTIGYLKDAVQNLRDAAEWRRSQPEDPHGVANAVITALEETATAIETALPKS